MSLFGTGLTVRYRRFRAHHEHTYPITFFLVGLAKFVLEIALLCIVCACLFLLALKVTGGKSGFITANDSQQSVEESAVVMTADAKTGNALTTEASVAAVSVDDDVSVAEETSSVRRNGTKPAENSLAVSTAVERSDAVANLDAPGAGPNAVDPASILKTTETVAVTSAFDDTLLQKVVVARSKEGADSAEQVAAVFDHEWVLTRPRDHFVIQLASSPRLDKLLEFSRELSNESAVAVFPFKVSSSKEVLYGVAVGEYTSVQQAMDAVKNYPDSAKRYSPWVRRLSDLQKEIKSINTHSDLQLMPVSMQ